jgi:hypothetical protein
MFAPGMYLSMKVMNFFVPSSLAHWMSPPLDAGMGGFRRH